MNHTPHLAAVEQAMTRIRHRQSRQSRRALSTPTPATFDVLDAVEAAEHTQSPPTVTTIATALSIDQPRASKLVAKAVTAGLVERVADQTDGRRAFLKRTEAGRAASEEVHNSRRSAFDKAMSGWSDAEKEQFARLLVRFVDALP
ncbi:MarR family winged helix-turn-helix transcriptional regulator [Umezawaea tangerina]|uniref:DNA-binding MarR family transcriptional regulator n=1 Tax=Umezawaea tangerina TaxID=84725 RepID=A0A2T0T9E8_9PSEU|nr:MarR family winged helix-turn-helix transcriptional regulator [Umezawaea tangerina]PRY42291.1 DNA-binding MarR family transcriptional regulator [Umezawaea tangerina]